MVNSSKKHDARYWASLPASAIGQFLSNYKPGESDVTEYFHPNPHTLELQRRGASMGHYRTGIGGTSVYEERKPCGERVLDFKGRKILMAQFLDIRTEGGKSTEYTLVIVPGILMSHRDGRSEGGLVTSKVAVLPKSQEAEVIDLARKVFPGADNILVWPKVIFSGK